MEVINPRAALLSNFEVLALLRELESEQLAETRAALAVKKEQAENGQPDLSTQPNQPPVPEVCENLRTVEFEAIAHLSASFHPMVRQTPQGIQRLTKALGPYGLTKGEKLQIINLAPTEAVELYVIVEELEDRLRDHMDHILTLVQDSLSYSTSEITNSVSAPEPELEDSKDGDGDGDIIGDLSYLEPDDWVDDSGVMEYVDTEGAFEGDLDAEEPDE